MNTTPAPSHAFDEHPDGTSLIVPAAAFRAGVRAGRYPVIPDAVASALSARDELEAMRPSLYAGAPPRSALAESLLNAVVAGSPPQAALDAAVDAHIDLDRRDIAAGLLQQAMAGTENVLRSTITTGLPEILGGLRIQLDDAVESLRAAYRAVDDLDVHQPDPMLVAQASKAQRDALVSIAEGTKRYHRIRSAQRDALTASSLPVPGDNVWRAGYGWKDFFATGLHEVSAPAGGGMPGRGLAPRLAVRAVAMRPDVWLPDPDEMVDAYDRLQLALRNTPAQNTPPLSPPDEGAGFGELDPAGVAFLDAVTANNAGGRR